MYMYVFTLYNEIVWLAIGKVCVYVCVGVYTCSIT